MDIKLLLFGVVREMVGDSSLCVKLAAESTVQDLKNYLHQNYPDTKKLKSLLIAVNEEYADDTTLLSAADAIAIIPPVSGG